jgi:hypothetical protein
MRRVPPVCGVSVGGVVGLVVVTGGAVVVTGGAVVFVAGGAVVVTGGAVVFVAGGVVVVLLLQAESNNATVKTRATITIDQYLTFTNLSSFFYYNKRYLVYYH